MYENYGWKYVLTALIAILWGAALVMNEVPLGLDLQGGDELIYQLRDPDHPDRGISSKETDDTVQVLQDRIDVLGIKELSIRRLGLDKIVIQVPGATKTQIQRIQDQIERSGKLQFKILVTDEMPAQERADKVAEIVAQKREGFWKDSSRYDVADIEDPRLMHPKYGVQMGPNDWKALLYHCTPSGKQEFVEGSMLASAERAMDNNGLPCVGFNWGTQGKKAFYKLTSENVNKNLAVILDGKLRSAPVIKSAIGKHGIIEMWDRQKTQQQNNAEINGLIVILKAGALPAKPVLAYSKKVGAQLGHQAVKVGSLAILGALGVVVLFMIWYYGSRAGLVADIALGLNLFLIVGTLSMFGATLTLPGIAGILLTAGMAVDANILIYERIREEIARGAALRQAIQAGYDRAFWTIFDANLTTALTAVVLMWVGTGPIKGFGLTLTIGIVVSMFTALFVTRALYGFFVAKEIVTEVKFKQLFDRPAIAFSALHKRALMASGTFILVGWLVFLWRGSDQYGIDFTGGTVISLRLAKPMTAAELEARLKKHFADQKVSDVTFEVQRMGEALPDGKSLEWQIRTRRVEDSPTPAAPAAPQTGALPSTGSLMEALLPSAYGQEAPVPPDAPAAPEGGKTEAAPEGAKTAQAPEEPKKTEAAPTEPKKTEAAPTEPKKTEAAPTEPKKTEAAPTEPKKTEAAPTEPKQPPTPAPVSTQQPAAPVGPAAPAAPAGHVAKQHRDQDFFRRHVEETFEKELVEPYPTQNGADYTYTPVDQGTRRAVFRVNMVMVNAEKGEQLTAETVKSQLPGAFRSLKASLDPKKARDRIQLLDMLVGNDGAPRFTVTALPDPDTNDGMLPFEFTTAPMPAANDQMADDMVAVFKEGLEKAQTYQATFAPAVPFPSVDTVGAAVAKNLSSKALMATFFCVVLICLYTWMRFDFWSGIAAIVAVFHDVLCLLGFLSILDWFLSATGVAFDVKFNLTTISAFLTLVGYSINDTIVILDRIREDKAANRAKEYTAAMIDESINKTLSRTVLTSFTTLLVCSVLLVASFAGLSSIQGLSVALLFGIAVGTYSSIFVAAPILLLDKRKLSMTVYAAFGFLLVTWLLRAGQGAVAGVVVGVMVAVPLALSKLGAFQVAELDTGKKK